jgi:chitodextrinase
MVPRVAEARGALRGNIVTNGRRRLALLILVLSATLVAEPAFATAVVSRAELDGSKLRIEGTATPSRDITVDGVAMAQSDSSGQFRVQREPYAPPADCTIDVNDGSATATVVRLSGCTVTQSGDTTPPTAPTNLTAALTDISATLSWTASTDNVGVAGYQVRRNGTTLAGTITSTSFTDPGLAAGTYTYTVVARDSAGNTSSPSTSASVTIAPAEQPADTTPPSVPANFTLALRGYNNTELAWGVSSDDTAVAGYRVIRNGTIINASQLYLNPSYGDSLLPPGTYTYAVAAVDTSGNMSAWTDSQSVTVVPPPETDNTAPTAPTSPTATVVGTTISLGWGMSYDDTGVAGYRITRNGSVVATTTSASHVDSGLAAGTYTYTIVAFDAAGNTSAQSSSVSATVQADQGLYFITPALMPDARVGEAYLGYIVCSDPAGPSTFKFKLISGAVPAGMRFSGNTLENRPEARVTGTPTRSGTFSFTVEVKDNTGATVRRTFTIRVLT